MEIRLQSLVTTKGTLSLGKDEDVIKDLDLKKDIRAIRIFFGGNLVEFPVYNANTTLRDLFTLMEGYGRVS